MKWTSIKPSKKVGIWMDDKNHLEKIQTQKYLFWIHCVIPDLIYENLLLSLKGWGMSWRVTDYKTENNFNNLLPCLFASIWPFPYLMYNRDSTDCFCHRSRDFLVLIVTFWFGYSRLTTKLFTTFTPLTPVSNISITFKDFFQMSDGIWNI